MTAIAIFWEAHEIVAAADGLEVIGEAVSPPQTPVSKIRQAGDTFFVLSGLAGCDEVGFDAAALVSSVLAHEAGGLRSRMARVEAELRGPAQEAREFIRIKRPADYAAYLEGRFTLLVAAFGAPSGQLGVSLRRFDENEVATLDVQNYTKFAPFLSAPGETRKRFHEGRTVDHARSRPRQSAREFIEAAIEDSPGQVGPPISVVSVSMHGVEWL